MASTHSWQQQWLQLLHWLFQVIARYLLLRAILSK